MLSDFRNDDHSITFAHRITFFGDLVIFSSLPFHNITSYLYIYQINFFSSGSVCTDSCIHISIERYKINTVVFPAKCVYLFTRTDFHNTQYRTKLSTKWNQMEANQNWAKVNRIFDGPLKTACLFQVGLFLLNLVSMSASMWLCVRARACLWECEPDFFFIRCSWVHICKSNVLLLLIKKFSFQRHSDEIGARIVRL